MQIDEFTIMERWFGDSHGVSYDVVRLKNGKWAVIPNTEEKINSVDYLFLSGDTYGVNLVGHKDYLVFYDKWFQDKVKGVDTSSPDWTRQQDHWQPPQHTKEEEPENNDGRDVCFWCGNPTKIVHTGMMSAYNICSVCGK